MKTKYVLIIFLTGLMINIIGAFLKITHMSFGIFTGNLVLLLGTVLQTLGILLFIFKILTSPKYKDIFRSQK